MRRVEVEWVDSAFHRGWGSAKTKRQEMTVARCRTVGYLIEATADAVKVAQSYDLDEHTLADGISIPRSAVKRIRTLRGGF